MCSKNEKFYVLFFFKKKIWVSPQIMDLGHTFTKKNIEKQIGLAVECEVWWQKQIGSAAEPKLSTSEC